MIPAVSIQNLRKTFGDIVAVDGVSLTVPRGEIYGLLGPNGAGKTTALRCLCTLLQPDSGEVRVCGLADVRSIRRSIGYVAQEVALDKVLTGRELLRLQAALYHLPRPSIPERIKAVLDLLQLDDYADKAVGTYSGGLKKRLDLAAGLLHQPQVLVMDEPTVGLDIQTRLAIWDFLRQLRVQGITVLLTSHYLEEVDALADRLAIVDKGKVIAEGTPAELKSRVGGDRITIKIREFAERHEAERALQVLQQLPFAAGPSINAAQGNAVNLTVHHAASGTESNADNVTGLIRRHLTTAGIPVFSIAQSQPSLDDVFLAATGLTLLDAEIAQSEKLASTRKKR